MRGRHEVLAKRNCNKYTFSNVVGRCGGEDAFCSLSCDLVLVSWWNHAPGLWTSPVFFSSFRTPLRWDQMASGGWCCLGSGRIISLEVTERSGIFHHCSIFPPPAKSLRGFFSDIHCDNLVELWELKLTKVWDSPIWLVPLGFLSLRLVHSEPLAIHQLHVRFPYSGTDFFEDFCSSNFKFSVSSFLPPHSLGWQFALWSSFSNGSKKHFWYFCLFRFLLVRIE